MRLEQRRRSRRRRRSLRRRHVGGLCAALALRAARAVQPGGQYADDMSHQLVKSRAAGGAARADGVLWREARALAHAEGREGRGEPLQLRRHQLCREGWEKLLRE